MLDRAIEAAVGYLVFGGAASLIVLALVLVACWSVGLRHGVRHAFETVKRAFVFGSVLFVSGLPASVVFTLAMRQRFYTDNDPLVDWLPWVPSGDWVVDVSCQGHYLCGASAWTLRVAWAELAVPVWALAIGLFRRMSCEPHAPGGAAARSRCT